MAEFNEQHELPAVERQGNPEAELRVALAIQGQEKTFALGEGKLVIESDTPLPTTEEERRIVEQGETTGFEVISTKDLPRETVTNDTGISTEYAVYKGEYIPLTTPGILVDRSKPWNRDAGPLPYLDLKHDILITPRDISERLGHDVSFFVAITDRDELVINTLGAKHTTAVFGFGEAQSMNETVVTPEATVVVSDPEVSAEFQFDAAINREPALTEGQADLADTALDSAGIIEPESQPAQGVEAITAERIEEMKATYQMEVNKVRADIKNNIDKGVTAYEHFADIPREFQDTLTDIDRLLANYEKALDTDDPYLFRTKASEIEGRLGTKRTDLIRLQSTKLEPLMRGSMSLFDANYPAKVTETDEKFAKETKGLEIGDVVSAQSVVNNVNIELRAAAIAARREVDKVTSVYDDIEVKIRLFLNSTYDLSAPSQLVESRERFKSVIKAVRMPHKDLLDANGTFDVARAQALEAASKALEALRV